MEKAEIIKKIKSQLRRVIRNGNECLKSSREVRELSNSEFREQMLDEKQKRVADFLFLTGKFDINDMRDEVDEDTVIKEQALEMDLARLKIVYDAITIEGFKSVTYGLPRFIMTTYVHDSFFPRLIVSGIKINGEATEFNPTYMDKWELKLKELEKQMALLINDDFSISNDLLNSFMDIYKKYIRTFFGKLKEELIIPTDNLDEVYNIIILTMRNYIRFGYVEEVSNSPVKINRDNLNNYVRDGRIIKVCPLDKLRELLEQEELSEQEKNLIVTQMETIIKCEKEVLDYIKDGKVVKVMDYETFRKLLQNTLIAKERQAEYLVQMRNLTDRIARDIKRCKIEELKQTLLTLEERELYAKSLISGNIEATQIIKEIDAILELIIECSEGEEREELIEEFKIYFDRLREILEPQSQEVKEIPNILYYKDKDMVPLIFGGIQRCSKSEYKQIYSDIIKILKGNVGNDPFIKDNHSPIPVYVKGKKFKIFYLVINGVTLIIDGGSATDGYKNVLNILRNKEFKNYLGYLQANLNEELLANEASYNELVLNELKKSERVRKLATLS